MLKNYQYFDFSEYKKDHPIIPLMEKYYEDNKLTLKKIPLHNKTDEFIESFDDFKNYNKKVVGKMKDENTVSPM